MGYLALGIPEQQGQPGGDVAIPRDKDCALRFAFPFTKELFWVRFLWVGALDL